MQISSLNSFSLHLEGLSFKNFKYPVNMKHNFTIFTLLLTFCFSTSLLGQKNPTLQQANKEYDLHAYSLAIKTYRKVLEKDHDNVAAMSGIADSYRHLGRMNDAAQWYKSALQIAGVDPVNLFEYGKTL